MSTDLEDAPLAPGADQFPQEVDDGFNTVDDSDSEETTSEAEPESPDDDAEPEGEESPEAEPEETPEPEVSEFDDAILADAGRYGWDADKLKTFGSPEAARFAMAELDRQAALWGQSQIFPQEQQAQNTSQQDSQQQNTQQANQQTQQQAQQQAEALLEKFKIEGNPEDWDENAYKALTGINDHYHNALSQQHKLVEQMRDALLSMHGQFQSITSQQQQAEASREASVFDGFFGKLDPEFGYGKGTVHTLKPDSDEFKARSEFAVAAKGLLYADQIAGRHTQLDEAFLNRVLAAQRSDTLKQQARKEVEQKVKDRAKQAIARPAGKNAKSLSARDKAIAFAEENSKRLK